jgi:spore coat protein U-like protein
VQSYVAKINTAQTTPPAGSYSDTVSVIITF